jgi:8-oxo-dGTP pyrophosphatase MutT (NUDIX family)
MIKVEVDSNDNVTRTNAAGKVANLFDVSSKVFLFNEDKSKIVLLVHDGGRVGIPGGHIDAGETPDQAARRELKEEIGIDYDGELIQSGFDSHVIESRPQWFELYYTGKLDDSLEFPELADDNPDQISERKWVPVDDVLSGEFSMVEAHKKLLLKFAGRSYDN